MTITVFHKKDPNFSGNPGPARADWDAGKYEKVAVVDTDDLDVAYEKTNNVNDLWVKNEGILETANLKVYDGVAGARSTSMGDILQKGDELFIVARMGFGKI